MRISLVPDGVYESYQQITPELLQSRGIRLLLSDLDYTLAPKSVSRPDQAVRDWLSRLQAAGIRVMILSNNRSPRRVEQFCRDLGITYVGHAKKPQTAGFRRVLAAKRFVIVACGTSWHAALIGKHLIESFCRIPVEVEYASEFRYRDPVIDGSDVVIAISQSGETADTLAAVELAKSRGAFIYGICNAVGSSIPRATHTGSYIHVGPEIGVASTKAFTGQVTVLTMLALALAREKHTVDEEQYLAIVRELGLIPEKMKEVLKLNDSIAELSKIFTYARNFIYLGRGYSYPVALEGALKLKEISYIHAEGYPAAEMKHGPIALIDAEMPVVVIATQNGLYEKVLSNIQEIKARKGRVIAIVTKGDEVISKIADTCIELPGTMECLDPLITAVPLQLLAYHIAVCKGMDVDQPRNLAKSVTVE